jgi:hypothetical protein
MSREHLLGALSDVHHDLLVVLAIDRHRVTLGPLFKSLRLGMWEG